MMLTLRTGRTLNAMRLALRWHYPNSPGGRSTKVRRFAAVVEGYYDLVTRGVIEEDARQIQVAERLDRLARELERCATTGIEGNLFPNA